MPLRRFVFRSILIWLAAIGASVADDWPQFRGPGGQGHAAATGLPLHFSESENVAWKVPVVGRGFSSPVVLGDQIWMTTAHEEAASAEEAERRTEGNRIADLLEVDRRVLLEALCYDRAGGKLLSRVTLFDVEDPDPIQAFNSYASPTPVIEPGRLYCDFGTNGTACLDTATGEVVWRRRLRLDHQVGPGSSPVLHEDLLVLVRDGCDAQYVTALDKRTGQTVWKTERPPIEAAYLPYRKAFSTPLVIETGGSRQVVVPGAKWVVSYEPATGRPIWWANYGAGFSNAPRPVFGHGMVYICTGFASQQLWAIRADGRGDVTETHVAWKASRQIPKRSSPLLVGDELYLVADAGVATCFDARTGETRWCERIAGNYSASPVLADGRIYFCSQEGKITLLKPGTEFVRLAENHLNGRLMASPVIVDRALLLRSDTHLYRIEQSY
ncbi:MAG: PQQ-binding-like beta-propeller repeat protein [Pirellulales bacterium]|nr:PQQ-binding-like beta-propeller repeat protein [Pirellulales bacterium]